VPDSRAELGLVPNPSGQVTPVMWTSAHTPVKAGEFHVDDRLDFIMAAEPGWELPHDSNSAILDAIGAEKFDYKWIAIDDAEDPWAILVKIHQVRLGDLIVYADALGLTEFRTEYKEEKYTIRLDGAVPDEYNLALVYNDEEKLIAKIKLR